MPQSLKQKIAEARRQHLQGTAKETYHATIGGTYIRDVV